MLETIKEKLDGLTDRAWYQMMGIFLGSVFLTSVAILFFSFRSMGKWKQAIDNINESRQTARALFTRADRIRRQRQEVTALLEEDPNFKIKGYFQDVLGQLGLSQKLVSESDTTIEREDDYRENLVTYQFNAMSMQQLTQLLDVIEQNKRLFTKELELAQSKKTPRTIDVVLTVATMQPKVT